MPQMAPIMWNLMFILSMISILMIMTKLYFSSPSNPGSHFISKNQSMMNKWLW